MSQNTLASSPSGANFGGSNVDHIQNDTGALFSQCLHAFHSFSDLAELAEDMRILSLNAELAAGRAGDQGSAVRALTQYTRELVHRLNAIEGVMLELKSKTYGASAGSLRFLRQIRFLDRALNQLKRRASDENFTSACIEITSKSQRDRLGILLDNVQDMVDAVDGLSQEATTVSEVMSQAGSIATNIAIEAAASGAHEDEFKQVAHTMGEYVEQLRDMVENASGAIRDAVVLGRMLQERARDNLSQTGR